MFVVRVCNFLPLQLRFRTRDRQISHLELELGWELAIFMQESIFDWLLTWEKQFGSFNKSGIFIINVNSEHVHYQVSWVYLRLLYSGLLSEDN